MKKVLLASVATGALALAAGVTGALTTADSANAADLRMPLKAPPPPAPVFSWSGCYVGAHWGWGWGKKTSTANYFSYYSHRGPFATEFGSFSDSISGPVFGGQVGCDYQWPGSNFVIGVEGSYSAADINNFTNEADDLLYNGILSPEDHTKVDGLASVTGRLGWNGWDPSVLFYVKGGWAWAHERDIIELYGPFTNSRSGWTIGGGIEWAFSFAPRWSAFVEYAHYSFGHKDICFYGCTGNFFFSDHASTKLNLDVVKVGINYKLFSPF